MSHENFISGRTQDEVWEKITAQFLDDPDPLEYSAVIEHESRKIALNIDIDLGGGFESGFESTTFAAHLNTSPSFRFAIHEKHFTDEIGKFFGMEDVEIGFEEFDKALIVKTNDTLKLKDIFSDSAVRAVFQSLTDFTFGITHHHASGDLPGEPFLELQIEHGITNVERLRQIYNAFYSVLAKVDAFVKTPHNTEQVN